MNWIIRCYRAALWLYPAAFRERYAQEMEGVFSEAMAGQPALAAGVRLLAHEAAGLPAALINAYLWAARSESGQSLAMPGGGSLPTPEPRPALPEVFLAVLSSLLIGLLGGLPYLLNLQITGPLGTILPFIILFAAMLLALLYGLIKGWGRWSAGWQTYFYTFPLVLLAFIFQNVLDQGDNPRAGDWANIIFVALMPLMLAFLLYIMTCKDRVRGLLAALPVMAVLWIFFHEFVPALPKGLAYLWTFGLAGAASAIVLQTRSWNTALAAALAAPVIGGFPNAYLGVYMGGTLPFSEPGPSLGEVFRQYLPFLATVCAMVLGPLLAWQVRRLGFASAGAAGKRWHRLALSGILLALLTVVFVQSIASMGGNLGLQRLQNAVRLNFTTLLLVADLVFLLGFVLLVRSAIQSGVLWSDRLAAARLALLCICLAGLPFILLWMIPDITRLFDALEGTFLIPLLSLAWIAASAWVVKD